MPGFAVGGSHPSSDYHQVRGYYGSELVHRMMILYQVFEYEQSVSFVEV